ncbi:hypothetical protein D5045_07055 [Verminephrobacter eiseniae]|uniref:hypothetical protein n=1 Tax=Verminephrobacter eiseniae TaxID=364317 RepID=UPI002237E2E5|nr:hypothetical protein [Verminephrobacter eiseniae]MCW5260013.1 hypothetical protein [Verminephrobacter eiseniae]
MRLKEATDWVFAQAIAQGADLKTDGYAWTVIVDDAVDKFDVDIEQLDTALCAALSLAAPPPSPLRPASFEAVGLKVVTDSVAVARYGAMPRLRISRELKNDAQEAFEAGRAAFRSIAAGLSDHYIYGKSRPREPKCPYRMGAKRQAWQSGYDSEREEFMPDLLNRD